MDGVFDGRISELDRLMERLMVISHEQVDG